MQLPFETPSQDVHDRVHGPTEALDADVIVSLTGAKVLHVERGTSAGQRFALHAAQSLIGRSAECDVRLLHPTVGRRHAQLRFVGDRLLVSDLGSQNGTYLNGLRLREGTEVDLRHGDVLVVGNSRLRLLDADSAGSGLRAVSSATLSQPPLSRRTAVRRGRSGVLFAVGAASAALAAGLVALLSPLTFGPAYSVPPPTPLVAAVAPVAAPPTPSAPRAGPAVDVSAVSVSVGQADVKERFEEAYRAAYRALTAKDRAEALDRFKEALELDERLNTGKRAELTRNLAALYTLEGVDQAQAGQPGRARMLLKLALQHDPGNALAKRKLAALGRARPAQRSRLDDAWEQPAKSARRGHAADLDAAFDSAAE